MKEKIFSDVQRLGKARTDFVRSVRDFAQEICCLVRETSRTLYLGRSAEGVEYCVEIKYSNIGQEWYLFVSDEYGRRALNEARLHGGSEFLHGDFNAKVEYATYSDCLEFVAYMRDEFGTYADECIRNIEKNMSFFNSSDE